MAGASTSEVDRSARIYEASNRLRQRAELPLLPRPSAEGFWSLPYDLIAIVLSALDLQSLNQCRLVCRAWERLCYRLTPAIDVPPQFSHSKLLLLLAMYPMIRILRLPGSKLIWTNLTWRFLAATMKPRAQFDVSLIEDHTLLSTYRWQLYYAEMFEEALPFANKCIALLPTNAIYRFHRSQLYHGLRKYELALTDLDEACKLDPNNSKIRCSRGLQLFAESIAELSKAIELDPNDYESWNNRGLSYFKMGAYQQAFDDFDHSQQIAPRADSFGLYNRARSLQQLGRLDEAKADFKASSEMNTRDSAVKYRYGRVLEMLGQKEEALELFKSTLEMRLALKDGEDFHAQGQMLQRFGRHEEAIEALDQAVRMQPHNPEYYEARAISLAAVGRTGDSMLDRDKALKEQLKMAELRGDTYLLLVKQ